VDFGPEPRMAGNGLVGAHLGCALFCVFRSTLQGYQSIDRRPLTVIRDCLPVQPISLYDGIENEYGCLTNCLHNLCFL
jgi:hypothetical protein